MVVKPTTLILLSLVLGVQPQGRFFFKKLKPFVTVTRTSTSIFLDTVFPSCIEVVDTTACQRRKRQMAFLVDPLSYYHQLNPQHVIRIQPTIDPGYRFFQPVYEPYQNFLSYIKPKPVSESRPVIEPSFEKAEGESRFLGKKFVEFKTNTATAIQKVIATETQTLEMNCFASGQVSPSDQDLCTIKLTFPPLPPGVSLQAFCEGAARVAKMKLAGFKFVSRRKREVLQRQDLYYTTPCQCEFFRLPGGDFPSRKKIAENFLSFCGKSSTTCDIPGAGSLDLSKVKVPGFDDIFKAAGTAKPSGSAPVG